MIPVGLLAAEMLTVFGVIVDGGQTDIGGRTRVGGQCCVVFAVRLGPSAVVVLAELRCSMKESKFPGDVPSTVRCDAHLPVVFDGDRDLQGGTLAVVLLCVVSYVHGLRADGAERPRTGCSGRLLSHK